MRAPERLGCWEFFKLCWRAYHGNSVAAILVIRELKRTADKLRKERRV